jgi:hypothetical protein
MTQQKSVGANLRVVPALASLSCEGHLSTHILVRACGEAGMVLSRSGHAYLAVYLCHKLRLLAR